MPVDPSLLAEALREIEKRYKGAIHPGSTEQQLDRLSTGSLELDYATGGGVPLGRCSHLWGSWSAGKSLIGWQVIRAAQLRGLSCAYYNIEKQFDPVFTRRLGVDLDKLHVVDETTIEGVGTILDGLLESVHVHVLDSLAAAVSIDELNAKLEDWQIGLAARAWGKVLRRANDRMDRHENCVLMINHARDNFRGGEGAPGGRFIEHQSSCTIHFRRGKWLFYNGQKELDPAATSGDTVSGDVEADGVEIIARVEKNRAARPLRTARIYWDYQHACIDHVFELMKAARYTGVANETGPGRFELEGKKYHGRNKLRAAIAGSPDLQLKIRDALLAAA